MVIMPLHPQKVTKPAHCPSSLYPGQLTRSLSVGTLPRSHMTGDIQHTGKGECLLHKLLKRKGEEHRKGVAGLPLLVQHLLKQAPALPAAGRAALQA